MNLGSCEKQIKTNEIKDKHFERNLDEAGEDLVVWDLKEFKKKETNEKRLCLFVVSGMFGFTS